MSSICLHSYICIKLLTATVTENKKSFHHLEKHLKVRVLQIMQPLHLMGHSIHSVNSSMF